MRSIRPRWHPWIMARLQRSRPSRTCLAAKHVATECAACSVGKGEDWCHGECRWDVDEEMCKFNVETTKKTTTTDKYPGIDESADSDDAIATKLRSEEAKQEKLDADDRQNFWIVVGLSAGFFSLVVMCCGVIAICFCFNKKPPKVEEPVEVVAEPEIIEDGAK